MLMFFYLHAEGENGRFNLCIIRLISREYIHPFCLRHCYYLHVAQSFQRIRRRMFVTRCRPTLKCGQKKACKFQCANDLLGSQVYASQKKTSTVIFKFDSLCKRLHGNERYFKGVQLQKLCKTLSFVSPWDQIVYCVLAHFWHQHYLVGTVTLFDLQYNVNATFYCVYRLYVAIAFRWITLFIQELLYCI